MSHFEEEKNSGGMHGFGHSWLQFNGWFRSQTPSARWDRAWFHNFPARGNGPRTKGPGTGSGSLWQSSLLSRFAVATLLAGLVAPGIAQGQQPATTKVPKIGKIRGGNTRQAFTGKVRSVDLKLKVLNMKGQEGASDEIFPFKKNVDLETASGRRLMLSELKAGSDVVIYYELKGGQRTVKQIILLGPGSQEAKKKPSPPS
jgi:hypothetical protein